MTAVLFVKDLAKVAGFYAGALGMSARSSDEQHRVLECDGFELVVHRIPKAIADGIVIAKPPRRRVEAAVRLDYTVHDVDASRRAARALGGDIDDAPPPWADRGFNLYLGHDPEGNPFGVREKRDGATIAGPDRSA